MSDKRFWPVWVPISGARPWRLMDQHEQFYREVGGHAKTFKTALDAENFVRREGLELAEPQAEGRNDGQ